MSLMVAVALTHLVSAVIVIVVFPMLLSDHPPAWLVQADPYDEDGGRTGLDQQRA